MKQSTLINLHTRMTHHATNLRSEFAVQRERGGISVEYVVIAVGVFVLAGIVIATMTGWAQERLAELT